MQFSAQEDIESPAPAVFAAISDFRVIESLAQRKRIDLRRLDHLPSVAKGMSWDLRFRLRGKKREILLDLVDWQPPASYRVAGGSRAFDLTAELGVIPLAKSRSRLTVKVTVTPVTFPAKLLIQSAKLTKRRLDRRFAARFNAVAQMVAERAPLYT